jgi:hypothetical protein
MHMVDAPGVFRETFLRELGGATALAPRAVAPSKELADLWGVDFANAVASLVDVVGQVPSGAQPRVGELMIFPPDDWLPGKANAFDFMLREFFRRAALLAGAVPIGVTGCGDIWLVAPEGGVFLLDHELAEVHAIADSLESLALLLCTPAADPNALAGRVRGYNDVQVPEGIPLLEDCGDVRTRFGAAADLYDVLWFGRRLPAAPAPGPSPTAAHPSELIARALRAYLSEDDPTLRATLDAARAHPARLVRDAAASLNAKTEVTGPAARLKALGSLQ